MADATRHGQSQLTSPAYFIGSYTGTTAALTVNIGFQPSMILAWNVTDGDTLWLWSSEDTSNVVSIIATPATVANAVSGSALGFLLAACSTTTNENAKVFVFIAFR